jgi:hypothetical protein
MSDGGVDMAKIWIDQLAWGLKIEEVVFVFVGGKPEVPDPFVFNSQTQPCP